MHLFIDTTHNITLGLLNNEFNWLEYYSDPKIVVSTKLHLLIQQLLIKHKTNINEIESMIYIAGPGSYTGMRVAEGISQVLEWQGKTCYSFYHFEVPYLCGEKSGIWYADAFKGETFVYSWNEDKFHTELVETKNLKTKLADQNIFTSDEKIEGIQSTKKLIYNMPEKIFSEIVKLKQKKELYYYRSLEHEFQKC